MASSIELRPSELEKGNKNSLNTPLNPYTDSSNPSTSPTSTKSPTWSNYLCFYYSGLSSDDPALKRRSQYVIYGHVIFITTSLLMLILTFTVIIPAIMQDLVNQSNLSLEMATITNPTNTSFDSAVLGKFSNVGSLSAKVKMNTLTVSWSGEGGGNMLKLSNSNSLTIKNNEVATISSDATVDDMTAFSNFNTYLLHHETAQWTIDGTADVTAFGVTAQVNFHKTVNLIGANNFTIPPLVQSTNITNGTSNQLYIASQVTMYSPSNVDLNLLNSTMYFDLIYNDVNIGIGYIPNYQMIQGAYTTKAYIVLSYSNNVEYQEICNVMSNYSCGIPVNATMKHFTLQPTLTWIKPALLSISMDTQLPGCTDKLVKSVLMFNKLVPETIPYEMVVYNPQPTNMTIVTITGSIYYMGVNIATVDNKNVNILVPAYTTITSGQLPANAVNSPEAISAYGTLVKNGKGYVNMYTKIIGKFGHFTANIVYNQFNVSLIVVPI